MKSKDASFRGQGNSRDVEYDQSAIGLSHCRKWLAHDLASDGPVGGDKARVAADHNITDLVLHCEADGLSDETRENVGGPIGFSN